MKFSLVIPIYNVEAYLRHCLDSVLAQTMDDWEAVCVNDGSIDDSGIIVKDYATKDHRFKVLTQPNAGLSAARNAGMKTAQGEFILFLDSDDWLEPNALQVMSNLLDGEDLLCFSGRRFFDKTSTFNLADQLEEKTYGNGMSYYNENALLHRDFAFVCVVLRAYKASFLRENNLRFKEGIYHEDNLFTPMACYYAQKVRVINACLYNYRVRANSITDGNQSKRMGDMLAIANELAAFFVPRSGFDKTVVYRAITHHYQRVFADASNSEKGVLQKQCDWSLYRKVSRTKLRHRWNYMRNRL